MERRFQNLESRRIFVSRLANGTKKQHLLRLFQPKGAVHAVVRRKSTGNVAFITFSTISQTRDAVEETARNPVILHGRRLAIGMADAWNARDPILRSPRDVTDAKSNRHNGFTRPTELPAEVIEVIAAYMTYRDLACMEMVSKTWRAGVMLYLRRTSELSLQDWRWPRDWTSSNITKDAFVWVVKRCASQLMKGSLSDAEATTDLRPQCLTILASYATQLKVLDITGLRVLPSGLRTVGENLHQLDTLKLGQVDGPVDPELSWIFRNTTLQHFSASGTAILGTAFKTLNPTLKELELSDTPVRSCNLAEGLSRCTRLAHLKLKRLKDFGADVIAAIINNESMGDTLQHLTIDWCKLRLPQYEEDVEVVEVNGLAANFLELLPFNIENASTLPSRLTSVTTLKARYNGWIDNSFIRELGLYMRNLRELDLSGNTNVRGQFALEPLGSIAPLERLAINMLHPTVGAQFLMEFRQLKCLMCQDNEGVIDEDICGLITSCPTIQYIDLEGCKRIGRGLIDCVQRVFRGNPRDLKFELRVGGTGARSYRRDRRMMHVRINYDRISQDPYV